MESTVGPSFGAFAVSGDKALAFIQRKVDGEDREVALALGAGTGREHWTVTLGKGTYDRQGGDGSRSTPTMDGNRVYILGADLYSIFGFKELGTAPLKCSEIATGNERWSQNGFGSGGGPILADGNVLAQTDRGPIVQVEANPVAYREPARTQAFGGKCWTRAVASNGRTFARNDLEGVCLDVSPQTAAR